MKKVVVFLMVLFAYTTYSQWEPVNNGLYGGTISSLLSSEGAILAGTYGGVYSSTNAGEFWGLTNLNGLSIQTFLKVGNRIFAAGDKGIYYSDDNGVNWEQTTTSLSQISSLAAGQGILYAGSETWGGYQSTDNGETWVEISSETLPKHIKKFQSFGEYVLAGTYDGLYRLSYNNSTWFPLNLGLGSDNTIDHLTASANKIFVSVNHKLLVSTDNGDTWMQNELEMNQSHIAGIFTRGADVFVSTLDGLYYSSDEGEKWVKKNQDSFKYIYSMAFDGNKVYAGTPFNGIYVSNDNGASWQEFNYGITSMSVGEIAVNGEFVVLLGNDRDNVFYSSDGGSSWNQSEFGSSQISTVSFFKDKFYAGLSHSGIFVSTDNGVTWSENNSGIDNLKINSFAKDNDKLYAVGKSAYSTIDGSNWTKLNFVCDSVLDGELIAVLPFKDKIYIVTSYGGKISISTDNGISWEKNDNEISTYNTKVLSSLGDQIIAGTREGIFLSSNEGVNWENRSNGLSNKFVEAIETSGAAIVAATRGGLFVSTDVGLTWTDKTGNLLDSAILSIKANGQYLYAGTSGAGLYRAKLSDLGIKGVEEAKVANSLRIFPNPASEYLTIQLSEGTQIAQKIVITDLFGNTVIETPIEESSGQKIDVSSLACGSYVVTCGEKRATFIVVR